MRYLKQKIIKARESKSLRKQPEILEVPEVQVKIEISPQVKIEENFVKKNKPKRSPGNNVMRNYATAMVKFALSKFAEPFLSSSPLLRVMSLQVFRDILVERRRKINCILRFRELLPSDKSQDSEEVRAFKGLFREACRAFLKYFWVNWIYNSKLEDKSKYLKYRGKLLRRIENPEQFTYLESFASEKYRKEKSRDSKE